MGKKTKNISLFSKPYKYLLFLGVTNYFTLFLFTDNIIYSKKCDLIYIRA